MEAGTGVARRITPKSNPSVMQSRAFHFGLTAHPFELNVGDDGVR